MRTYRITQAGRTDIGHVRERNEDSLIGEGDLFAVADGMGGLGRGDVAARLALDELRSAFEAEPTGAGLVAAVRSANRAVHQRNIDEQDVDEAGPESDLPFGTTIAAVAYVTEEGAERLVVVNVGDSRVYRLRGGRLERLSLDHSKVAELVRAGSLTAAEAADHPERHILTQAIGVRADIEPAVTSAEPQSGDRLLLCSDGLYNEVSEPELLDLLSADDPPDDVAARLIERANERGGRDNITALVLDVR